MAEWNCFTCKKQNNNAVCFRCKDGSEYIKQTNADKIRSMTDEEMAMDLIPLIMEICEDGVPCEEMFLGWLQSEAE